MNITAEQYEDDNFSKLSKEIIILNKLKNGVKISSVESKILLRLSRCETCGEFINPPKCKCININKI